MSVFFFLFLSFLTYDYKRHDIHRVTSDWNIVVIIINLASVRTGLVETLFKIAFYDSHIRRNFQTNGESWLVLLFSLTVEKNMIRFSGHGAEGTLQQSLEVN